MSSQHHNRVNAVFSGEWPDRIPLCEQVFTWTVASAYFGREMFTGGAGMRYHATLAAMQGESAYQEFLERVYEDTITVHRHFDLDIYLWPNVNATKPTKQLDTYSFLYGDEDSDDWQICKFDPESATFGTVKTGRPAPSFEDIEQIIRDTLAKPRLSDVTLVNPMVKRAVREYGNEFVIAGSSFMSVPMQPGWLEATVLDPDLLGEWLDWIVEDNLIRMEAQHKLGIRIFNGGGDFAFNSGPVYSPDFFDRIMAPRWKRLFDWCREHNCYYVFRSDGNLWPVAESLFDGARPQAYYEVDHDAGMTFERIRAQFPELVLIGNISCDVLQRGSEKDVRKMTEECLTAAAPRVIIASANSILHGTPPENVIAMYDTVKNYPLETLHKTKNA